MDGIRAGSPSHFPNHLLISPEARPDDAGKAIAAKKRKSRKTTELLRLLRLFAANRSVVYPTHFAVDGQSPNLPRLKSGLPVLQQHSHDLLQIAPQLVQGLSLGVGAGESWNIADIEPSVRAPLHHRRVAAHRGSLGRLHLDIKSGTASFSRPSSAAWQAGRSSGLALASSHLAGKTLSRSSCRDTEDLLHDLFAALSAHVVVP